MLPSLLPNVFPNMRGSGGACGLLRVPLAKLPAAPACSFPHATTSTFSSDWPSTLDKRPALRRRNACGRINPTWDSCLALDDAPALPVLSDAVCPMPTLRVSKSIARLTSCSARKREVAMTISMGKAKSGVLRLDLDRRLTLQFLGSAATLIVSIVKTTARSEELEGAEMGQKYELVTTDTRMVRGATLNRIRRKSDGLLGGYVETEANLSQSGTVGFTVKAQLWETQAQLRETPESQKTPRSVGRCTVTRSSRETQPCKEVCLTRPRYRVTQSLPVGRTATRSLEVMRR